MSKFNQIASSVLEESTDNKSKIKNIVQSLSKQIEDRLIALVKKSGGDNLTDEQVLEVIKNFSKEIEREDLY